MLSNFIKIGKNQKKNLRVQKCIQIFFYCHELIYSIRNYFLPKEKKIKSLTNYKEGDVTLDNVIRH